MRFKKEVKGVKVQRGRVLGIEWNKGIRKVG
jgi:hypothetical protein